MLDLGVHLLALQRRFGLEGELLQLTASGSGHKPEVEHAGILAVDFEHSYVFDVERPLLRCGLREEVATRYRESCLGFF